MQYRAILQRVLEHIDSHIQEGLSAEDLASLAGFSTYHFCRVFQWGVGYSVMEYIRNRRLALAAAELSSGRRIIDIALDFGFETHSGFSKAFRRHFGSSPETYRIHAHYSFPPLPSLASMEKYAIGGIVMEPKLVTRQKIKIVGFVLQTRNIGGENNIAIPAFWGAYLHDGRSNRLHGEAFVAKHAEYGACLPLNPETGEFEYMIGVEPTADAAIPAGYEVREIPAATYVVFSTPPTEQANFSPTIQGLWCYIYSEWFPQSGYEYAPGCVDFEFYDERCATDKPVCDIYIPVVKKQA